MYIDIVCIKKALKDILKTHTFRSIVLPADLDFQGHMSNARYLREADIARCCFLLHYRIPEVLRTFGGYLVMTSNCCHFFQPLKVFQRFDIHTRLLGWEDRFVYLEQRFVQPSKGFIVATVIGRYNVIGTTPAVLMECLAGTKALHGSSQSCPFSRVRALLGLLELKVQVESPELPGEIQHWVKYNSLSSQRLRAESAI
ncbi:protein THEM6-like [Tiliqua scincoides]|uniref:protein THEM6-like n=1 Tax=Tiliqua scincoides TaxID=71010 RepID=UPI0034628EA2